MAKRMMTFEERERAAIERLEGRMVAKEAERIAKRKIGLGIKYGELDFKNISDQKLMELEKKEKREERKKAAIKKGKEILTGIGKRFKSAKVGKKMLGKPEQAQARRFESQGPFVTTTDGNLFGTMQHRNIHEDNVRDIWADKPKKTIWD